MDDKIKNENVETKPEVEPAATSGPKMFGYENKDDGKVYLKSEQELNDRIKKLDPKLSHQIYRGGKLAETINAKPIKNKPVQPKSAQVKQKAPQMPDFWSDFKAVSRPGMYKDGLPTNYEDNILQYYLRSPDFKQLTEHEQRDLTNLKNNPYIKDEDIKRLAYYQYLQKLQKDPTLLNRHDDRNKISDVGARKIEDYKDRLAKRFNDYRYSDSVDEEGNINRVESDEYKKLKENYLNELNGSPDMYSDAFKQSTRYSEDYEPTIKEEMNKWKEGQQLKETTSDTDEKYLRSKLENYGKSKGIDMSGLLDLPYDELRDIINEEPEFKEELNKIK